MLEGIHLVLLGLIIMFVRYMYRKYAAEKVENLAPVVNAVINHGKDTASQIKPAINNYVEKHQTTNYKQDISDTGMIHDNKMYEIAMDEIETGTVQKGLYARAFSQSEGDKDKTAALYINFRVQSLHDEFAKFENALTPEPKVELLKATEADKRAKKVAEELKIWHDKQSLTQAWQF